MLTEQCFGRLILREVLKEESVAIVVNLMKEQAGNESVIVVDVLPGGY